MGCGSCTGAHSRKMIMLREKIHGTETVPRFEVMACVVLAGERASRVPELQVLSSSHQSARCPFATPWTVAPCSASRALQCQNPSRSRPLKRPRVSGPRWLAALEAPRHHRSDSSSPAPGRHVVSSIPRTWNGCGRPVLRDSCRRRRLPSVPSTRPHELSAATCAMTTVR